MPGHTLLSRVHFESMIEGVSSDQEGRDAASIQWITGERGALPAELPAQLWFEKFDSQDSNQAVYLRDGRLL